MMFGPCAASKKRVFHSGRDAFVIYILVIMKCLLSSFCSQNQKMWRFSHMCYLERRR